MAEINRMHWEFGRNLSAHRKRKGFTQESLGKNMGVSRTYINRLERGRGNPTFTMVMRLSNALGIEASLLFFGIRYKD